MLRFFSIPGFREGLSSANRGSVNYTRGSGATWINNFLGSLNNNTANLDLIANASLVINNTQEIIEKIDQMDSEKSAANMMATGQNGVEPSTDVNAANDVIIVDDDSG